MKKKIRLLVTIFLAFVVFCLCNVNKVQAATATISNNQTVTPGQKVTVTATVTAGAWNLTLSGGGQSKPLVGQTSVAGNQTASVSISFVANSDTTVSLIGDMTDFSSDTAESVSKSSKVTVKASSTNNNSNSGGTSSSGNSNSGNTNQQKPQQPQTPTKSNVATLSNLGIRPNDFSGFKANTLTYNTEVPYETDKIEIYASKGQSGQTISGTGTKTLKEGQNSFNITVTAEDGKATKTYTINVTRKQQGETEEPETPTEENPEEPIEAFGLTDLKIEGLELNPEFQTDIHEYKIDLTEDLEKLNITASPTHPDTVVEITGNENLIEGENIITIVVKPEDEADNASENNIATYQIIVNKTLPKEEEANTEEGKIDKKVILISVGAIIVVIIVIFIIVKLRKNKDDGEYVTYTEFYAKDMEEIKEDEPIEENKEEDFEEEIKKKKRSKGKRFK